MIRFVVLTLLVVAGGMLAFDVGGAWMLLASGALNSSTRGVARLLGQNGFQYLQLLVGEICLFLTISPAAFGIGILASLIFGPRRATYGVAFWIAFALCATVRVGIEVSGRPLIASSSMLMSVGSWCTVPVYLIGIAIDRTVRRRAWPRFALIDLLVAPLLIAMFFSVPLLPHLAWRPAGYFVTLACIALRLYWPRVSQLANDPIQPEAERTEVASLAS